MKSIYCILPPHILKQIAKNGTAAQRTRAIEALTTTHCVRSFRATRAMAPHRSCSKAGSKLQWVVRSRRSQACCPLFFTPSPAQFLPCRVAGPTAYPAQ